LVEIFPARISPGKDYAALLLDLGVSQSTVDVIINADKRAMRGDLDSKSRDLRETYGPAHHDTFKGSKKRLVYALTAT
jgi:hypothetical protein